MAARAGWAASFAQPRIVPAEMSLLKACVL
jgi:hypothetical protein